jgi:hypothetical protein
MPDEGSGTFGVIAAFAKPLGHTRRHQQPALPAPNRPPHECDPESFAACYLNAYVSNGAVIGACFGDEERDEVARVALPRVFRTGDYYVTSRQHQPPRWRNSLPHAADASWSSLLLLAGGEPLIKWIIKRHTYRPAINEQP